MPDTKAAAIVLAAGKGTRMKSKLPKVMHRIAGRTLIGHVLDHLAPLKLARVIAVIAPGMDDVTKEVAPHGIVFQAKQLGTGHAVGSAREAFKDFSGDILVVYGDTPFVATVTLQRMFKRRREPDNPAIVVLGMRPVDPTGYGRLVLGSDGTLDRIVEHKDATEAERAIGLANSGVMAIDGSVVWSLIDRLDNKNAKGEFYLTDIVAFARKDGRRCAVVEAPAEELLGVNSRSELAAAEALFQTRARIAAMENGATLTDPASVFFAADTKVGRDVVIGPNVQFGLGVEIADDAEIRAFCHIEGAKIESGAIIGPFARIRPRTTIGAGAHVGNFIELKATEFGAGAKANHVSYLGDSTIGAKANIGAGTIVCNYDGVTKSRSTIGAGAFVGSDSVLVSPVTVGEGAYVAAGSVITHDVPPDALAIARSQQTDKPGWATKFRAMKSKKKD
ncbi:bifunctional UDP-N-acetylglucosamine diphosphorylase/glucosamine-1-phosphate N-acetyltransferase GlmU [Dongia deserti]|uniref:bifunctional UDP-N-acetylglucosamine diphosphorylase/glucosamine-1-phosphate N-acetyltransferase GlmU n=1 Tax=Dongia deserti TaxID=2268030 RepID=UPI000E649BD4|nr:bifunctional UDP-N-acetylglucosamine diphosphorylase/glucosamine-1-phosphate N-acetyltransferase GlmU [Dongia deserti]